jgi:hypothetical protein
VSLASSKNRAGHVSNGRTLVSGCVLRNTFLGRTSFLGGRSQSLDVSNKSSVSESPRSETEMLLVTIFSFLIMWPLSLVSTTQELLDRKVAAPV